MLTLVLGAFGFVLLVLAGIAWVNPTPPNPDRRFTMLSFGLALWLAAEIIARAWPSLGHI